MTKLAHYSETFSSKENEVIRKIDFNQTILKGYEIYDVLILADNGKIMLLSEVFNGNATKNNDNPENEEDSKDSSKLWILAIVIPIVLILIIALIIFIRHKNKKNSIDQLMTEDKEDKEMILPLKEI